MMTINCPALLRRLEKNEVRTSSYRVYACARRLLQAYGRRAKNVMVRIAELNVDGRIPVFVHYGRPGCVRTGVLPPGARTPDRYVVGSNDWARTHHQVGH